MEMYGKMGSDRGTQNYVEDEWSGRFAIQGFENNSIGQQGYP